MSCGSPATETAAPISTSAADATAPGQAARAVALMTEVRSAGEPCAGVTRTFFQGHRNGGDVWDVECSDGHSYGITSKADGSTEVMECGALENATGSKCFTKF
jgi:hypothetical protein